MMQPALVAFAQRLVALTPADLPTDVAHETRRCFTNVLGAAIGASRSTEFAAIVRAGRQLGGAEVTVLGQSVPLDRFYAATALGFAGHFDDFDDTHLATVIHPGAATLGALYPLALLNDANPETVLMAMALGIEVQLRVGIAMSPSHYDLGWHITGTCGVMGAAVGAGVVLGLSGAALANAIGIAATMTVGHREAFGTSVKPYHAGKAAANGMLASALAQRGLEAPMDILGAERGLFAVLCDRWSGEWLAPDDVGRRWALRDVTYKPYPCGIVAHPAIEASISLHVELDRAELDRIEQVEVRCNPLVVELMGRATATTGLEARFCARHGVAVGLLWGRAGLVEFSDESSNEPSIAALRERIELRPDANCCREAATITVHLRDGTTRVGAVETATGSSARPLSDGQLREKFVALVEPVLPDRAERIFTTAMQLGNDTTIEEIERLLQAHG